MNESYIEQVSIESLMTGTPEEVSKLEKQNLLMESKNQLPSSFQQTSKRKPKYFAYIILTLMALVLVLIYFKNSSNNQEPLVDYRKHSFFKMTVHGNANLQWDVFVDITSSQTYLVKTFSSTKLKANQKADLKSQRAAAIDQGQTFITHVLTHKFDDPYVKFYQIIEGDVLNHEHCFKIDSKSSFNIAPRLLASKFQQNKKIPFENINKNELKSSELGLLAEIQTDMKGELIGFHFADENSADFASFRVSDPFDIQKIKTKLEVIRNCYAYDLELNETEHSYNNSHMKCPVNKYNEASRQSMEEQNNTIEVIKNLAVKLEYGNWCGPHHGGFANDCYAVCNEDPWRPTDKCVACCPPVDYTDVQCMWHDVCSNRHDVLNWGSSGCEMLNSSFLESIPCECDFALMNDLREEKLVAGCQENQNCTLSGRLIRTAFLFHPCGCKVKTCFIFPTFEQTEPNGKVKYQLKQTCIDYDTCLPASICSLVQGND